MQFCSFLRRRSLGALAIVGLSTCHRSLLPTRPALLPCCLRNPGVRALADAPGPEVPGSGGIVSLNPDLDYTLPFRVLAFYVISPVDAAESLVEVHREFLARREMVGRVYLSADGLNAQVSGSTSSCLEYREFIAAAFPSTKLLFKEDPVAEPAFPKLRVKMKRLVPALPGDADLDLSDRGRDLAPEEWAAMLEARGEGGLVLDVRNSYEWDVRSPCPTLRPGRLPLRRAPHIAARRAPHIA